LGKKKEKKIGQKGAAKKEQPFSWFFFGGRKKNQKIGAAKKLPCPAKLPNCPT
jgi:hypothetical protein